MIVSPQPSCHNRLKSLNSFSVSLLGKIPRARTETDPIRHQKLLNFLEKIKKSPVRRFGSPHELAAEVVASFVDLKLRHPAIGFVRTDQVVEFKKYAAVLEEMRYSRISCVL